jgi:hypothetical protein
MNSPIQVIAQDINKWEELWCEETSEKRWWFQQEREIIQERIFKLVDILSNMDIGDDVRRSVSEFVSLYVFQRRWSSWKAEYDVAKNSGNQTALVRLGQEWDHRCNYLGHMGKTHLIPDWCTE